MNHYEVLGVSKHATSDEIKKAYRKAARKAHPDRGGSDRAMVAVNQAYDCLSDPGKREYYDLHGEDEPKRQTVEAQALHAIYQILMKLAEPAREEFNFVAAVITNLSNNRYTISASESSLKALLKKTERQKTCIERKSEGPNLLTQVFDQKISQIKAQIEGIPGALAVVDKALEIMKEYKNAAREDYGPQVRFSAFADRSPLLDVLMKNRGF